MFLLDTPILLELRTARDPGADPRLVAWASGVARERLFMSAVSLVEVEGAAMRAARGDKGAAAVWRDWIDARLLPAFEGHVLAVDAAVARRRGTLALADTRDALLAATAIEHGLTLVTRDRAAYRGARLRLLDPADQATDIGAPAETEDWRSAGRGGPAWLRNLFIRG
ncbi:VapC toxin family PIN domain ribonuclease [Sphingomonas spermidinifaciens]|uniref:Ribonuclease VapC n=1 Tax=Sphingomonas spermidinifaciens TaxID=1141889 RepID=A0A2A4B3W3_9SPHN|nr:PIN domain-containing protein [Sphingomonas spermidinifaciens]PCD02737.1 VapC toxin family PIN domain ribonuclease [Sphingomonas spermidinifaciens]